MTDKKSRWSMDEKIRNCFAFETRSLANAVHARKACAAPQYMVWLFCSDGSEEAPSG